MAEIFIDVEEPDEDLRTISLEHAVKEFSLGPTEIEELQQDLIVWCGEATALSLHKDI